jgi:hypothetical protein
VAFLLVLACGLPLTAAAQEQVPVRDGASEPQGWIAEPEQLTRAALFADRQLSKGDRNSGFYLDFGNMIPGAGWLSVGPGYRRWMSDDRWLLDASAAISTQGYRTAQGRIEAPALLRSRLAIGAQARWVDFRHVDYYGLGPDSLKDAHSEFAVRATHMVAHATVRPVKWLGLGAEAGILAPDLPSSPFGGTAPLPDQPTFTPVGLSLTADTRNFPAHPTRGVLVRAAASHFADRDAGAFTFRRYDGHIAGFVPMAGERVVLALRGRVASTIPQAGADVPFYLLPSLGGATTLRSFANYRFRDRHVAVANAEVRLALMTHLDVALFADAGNVAARARDLNFDQRSYGLGLRFHTRRQSMAIVDVAHGREGWRVLFRLTDPFAMTRLNRRAMAVPFVP